MSSMLLYSIGVIAMVIGVGASIALHELGHFMPAKKFGVRIPQYMIGFGPTLWSRRTTETEYGVKWIPLGGYVRMIGMFPPKPGDDPSSMRVSSTGRLSQLVDEARRATLEEVRPGDENRVFYKLSTPKKLVIMLGGPTMNLLIGVALMAGLVTAYGMPVTQPGAVVATVSECVVKASQMSAARACEADDPKTPAYQAGLKPGDEIISVAGQPITSTTDVGAVIRERSGEVTPIVVERDGQRLTLTATPITNQLRKIDDAGQPVSGADGAPVYVDTGFLGIASAAPVVVERQSLAVVPGLIVEDVARSAAALATVPQKMVGVVEAAFGTQQRDPESPMSVVGVGRIAGEVTSGAIPLIDDGAAGKAAMLVRLLYALNLFLFLFNLIPLMPLDGGHVAGALWEGLKRQTARAMGRPDPGHVDVAKGLPIAYGMSMVLIVMSVMLIYADVVNPIRLGG